MAIPKISRANVLAAIEHIQREGMPPSRRSTKYSLVNERRRYPPKYVVSQAIKDAIGRALDPQEFGGDAETNSILRQLGFSVVAFSRGAVDSQRQPVTAPESEKRVARETEMVTSYSETVRGVALIGRVVVRG